MKILRKIKRTLKQRPLLFVISIYLLFGVVGSFLLSIPFFLQGGVEISYLDSFFTSSSAITTSGLSTVNFAETYNYFGWFVIILIFNVGGVGIIITNTLIFLFIGKKIGFSNRLLMKLDYNNEKLSSIVTITKNIIVIFWIVELIGAFFIFLQLDNMNSFIDRFMNAWFLSASATSGSGFYNTVPYINDFSLQYTLFILMIFSFIGYPVFIDLLEYTKAKFRKEKYNLTIFSKIVIKMNIITIILFAVIFFMLENGNTMQGYSLYEQIQYSFFMGISTKSVGLSMFADFTQFTNMTLIVFVIFMIIGGSPSSACGGVKVISIYLIYKHIISMIGSSGKVIVYNSHIKEENILQSYFLLFTFIAISFIASMLIYFANPSISIGYIFFDVVSGFTTTGFTTGALAQMNNFGIIIISFLMLMGRIGLVNLFRVTNERNDMRIKRVKHLDKELAL